MNNNNRNERNNRENQGNGWLTAGAIGLAAAAAVGGAAYLFSGNSKKKEQPQRTVDNTPPRVSHSAEHSSSSDSDSTSSYLSNMVTRFMSVSSSAGIENRMPRFESDFDEPKITNLNGLLNDIYRRYIKLQDFKRHYDVFDVIFNDLHRKMKEVDRYYRKYSSTVQFAGSHFDNLPIKKPDEFDMDIVIGLPLDIKTNYLNPADSDINIEPKFAGFVQLKMGVQFQRLPMRDSEEWLNNKAAFEWMGSGNYLLRSKFIEWFESVVIKALNLYPVGRSSRPVCLVDGVPYIIGVSKSGPAITLKISNGDGTFKMDVDLVPALKFPECRWPITTTYRPIPQKCKKGYWMVVPKPNKDSPNEHDQMRSWRIALHNQERELMYNSYNLRQTIRLMKKLRDAQEMKKIASYYVKTLFFWELEDIRDESYWCQSPAILFKRMVGKLHQALLVGKIPYYWNKNNNLIGGVSRNVLTQYANKLVPLMEVLDDPYRYKLVAKYLLTREEFADYNAKYLHI